MSRRRPFDEEATRNLERQDWGATFKWLVVALHQSGSEPHDALELAQETILRVLNGSRRIPEVAHSGRAAFERHMTLVAMNIRQQTLKSPRVRKSVMIEDCGDQRQLDRIEQLARRIDDHGLLPSDLLGNARMIALLRGVCRQLQREDRDDLARLLRVLATENGPREWLAQVARVDVKRFYPLRRELRIAVELYLDRGREVAFSKER
jgi:hypothetical protein